MSTEGGSSGVEDAGLFSAIRVNERAGIAVWILCCAAVSLLASGALATAFAAAWKPDAVSQMLWLGLLGVVVAGLVRIIYRERILAAERQRQQSFMSLLLRESNETTSHLLFETDAAGRLTWFSGRLPQLTGMAEVSLTGRNLSELLKSGGGEFAAALTQPQAVHDIAASFSPDGQMSWWSLSLQPLFGANATLTGFRGAGRDITTDRRLKTDLNRAKEDAELANQAKSQFLAVVSHELKTPLNAIAGFAELMACPPAPLSAAAQTEYAGVIHESSLHLRALIEDLLDITRIERGTLTIEEQEADAAEVAEIAAKMCRGAAETADAMLDASLPDGVEIRGDIRRIKQVLINLISNALKFSHRGRTVELRVGRDPSGGICFEVRDTGIGISPKDLARIFEPFVQAEQGAARRFGGMGLGLAIALRIARLHGGDIALESSPGKGTLARFTLPASRVTWPASQRAVA